jgi:isoleucyl-tRNA synthetase
MTAAEKDYKHTLNLPETSFPMQANLAQREPQMLARWESEGLYEKVQDENAGRPAYWFVDGPPYANGDIHIGHVVNKVLKDIVVKAARLAGYFAPFTPGWDCHGLPIELQVEKKHGKVGDKLDAKAFRAKCREYAAEQIDRQRADFKRLGILADWEHPYLTMQPAYEAEQLRALAQIVERGHVVRGAKPVHWCLDCGSSLAEAEVEYEDKKSPAIDVKFMAADAAATAKVFGAKVVADVAFVIWTTTPWTLPANQAITVHPEFDYVLADIAGHGPYVVVEPLLEGFAKRLGGAAHVLGRANGAALEGLRAQHPFAERSVPLILGEHVTLDAGTGLVHTAPAHGIEDFVVGQKYGLPADNPVAANGVFVEGTPLVAGQHVRKADALVLEGLRARQALAHQQEITHSYPHCWRHKTPLIFRATRQWFISMDARGLRPTALKGIESTEWIPEWGEARIAEMVGGRPDWCISRQRYWGVPLAFFVDKQTGALHPETPQLLRRVADRVQKEGLEAWFGTTAADWLGDDAARYDKLGDTLDVWFDSGVVHQCAFATTAPEAMRDGQAPVADMYLEGSDQHRGWFMSSLLTSSAMYGRAPFKAVLTHGFTVDEQGRKMSKSLGNVIAPQQVLKTLGADVMRLWVAASDYSGEIAISDNLLKRMADAYRRIRNTVRYLLGSLQGFDPGRDLVPADQLLAIDRWAVDSARAAGRDRGGVSQLAVPPRVPEGPQLRRRPRRAVPRRAEGPALHDAAEEPRAALGADRAAAHRRGAGALDRAGAVVHGGRDLALAAGRPVAERLRAGLARVSAGGDGAQPRLGAPARRAPGRVQDPRGAAREGRDRPVARRGGHAVRRGAAAVGAEGAGRGAALLVHHLARRRAPGGRAARDGVGGRARRRRRGLDRGPAVGRAQVRALLAPATRGRRK